MAAVAKGRKQQAGGRRYRVELGARAYDIVIEPGALDRLGAGMTQVLGAPGRALVVSDRVVADLYLEQARQSLAQAGWRSHGLVLPEGESAKTVENWSRILDCLMEHKLARNEPVVALGGGVVGDMAGFAAACYRRGVPLVQVPTTLLSQVDSSVGGKTAVNHPLGKNMIGAFYQPRLVWIDPTVLATLDVRQYRAGLAEVIKYGLIRDAAFFHRLEELMPQLHRLDGQAVAEVIHTSCRHKAEVVVRDEREAGERALLNLGHTFGHAIEAMTGYRRYLHGEAVAIGMRMAARLSERCGMAQAGLEEAVVAMLRAARLPVDVPSFAPERWLDAIGHDKKNLGERLRLVLLNRIGAAQLVDRIGPEEIESLLSDYRE
ncbi:MAG: 3-dehydroquinate synthase [Zetaproteobacteria bacterium]|nr:MAG: 3-dehydroquinate synthase [Zetaproteobacteria bacterium]